MDTEGGEGATRVGGGGSRAAPLPLSRGMKKALEKRKGAGVFFSSVRAEREWKKQERGMKRGRRNGAQASSALIYLDTNLFPRQLLGLDDARQPSHSSRGIVIPLCYVIDAVPVVTNSNSLSLIRLSRRTRSVYRVEII